jgi:polyketide synthase-associated protein
LSVKGFCTVDFALDSETISLAVQDAGLLEEAGTLYEPSALFLEGLLGSSGSARIAELEYFGQSSELPRSDHPHLSQLDAEMTRAVEIVYPYLGFTLASRTAGVLHKAGSTEGRDDIDDMEAAKWLAIFAHHRIMVIIFLGPSDGVLELRPFDEDALATKVPAKPGTVVLLRPDVLTHNFYATRGEAYCLTCFYTKDARPRKRVAEDSDQLTPCAEALDEWAMRRVQDVKEMYEEDDPLRPRLPRHWELVSNHSGFVGQHMAVRSYAVRLPSTFEMSAFIAGASAGTDFCIEVPMSRFNIDTIYEDSEDPDMWMRAKSNCKHASFIDGIEWFDSKLFRLSNSDTQGMDPGHRHILETGYECLRKEGYTSKTLMNSRGGVYVAADTAAEWSSCEREAFGGVCGGGNSVACGRVSFTFGLKGPCLASDCSHAGSLLMISECCTHLTHRGMWDPTPFGVCATYHFALSKQKWIQFSSAQLTSPKGRCLSFDASACGFARGECSGAICVKALVQMVDGSPVMNEDVADGLVGTLAGSAINQSGRRAAMTSPDGAALQEVMTMACRNAYISPLDVDAVECHANGSMLNDAVEASSVGRAYRPDGKIGIDETAPLSILASKTRTGDFFDSSGLMAILQVMRAMKIGVCMPMGHLRLLNPHIDMCICERPAHMAADLLETRLTSAFTGVSGNSFSGTNVHFLAYGQVDEEVMSPLPPVADAPAAKKITYWPEGGGKLEAEFMPRLGYFIAGSWSRFDAQAMESEGDGVYGCTITLGENRWEHFQIWLDGQKHKALHPGEIKAAKHSAVLGPEDSLAFNTWMLDGRPVSMWKTEAPSLAAAGDEREGGWDQLQVETSDTGSVGDKYRIRLRVSGKYRTVEWEKLEEKAELAEVPKAQYYVVGSWNDLDFEEMTCEDEAKGVFSTEVQIASEAPSHFFIVRNKDWMQVFYPAEPTSEEALGPEPMQMTDGTWSLKGNSGDVFKITFCRQVDATGAISQQVSQQRIAIEAPLREDLVSRQRLPVFHIIGTWDSWSTSLKMNWTGHYYQFFVELGDEARASFQILKDASYYRAFYPSVVEASLGDKYGINGPGRPQLGSYHWTIGKEEWSGKKDNAARGKRYEIRLFIENEKPIKVEWSAARSDARIEDALIRGFFAYGQ